MFKKGDTVMIKSRTSKYKNAIGTFIGYCKGKCPEICRVQLWKNKVIKICDYNIIPYKSE